MKKRKNGLVLMNNKRSVLDYVVRLRTTYELSFELAETMQVLLQTTVEYCKIHNIPINKESGLWSLVEKSRTILKEIEIVNSRRLQPIPDEFLQQSKPDEDFTEPLFKI